MSFSEKDHRARIALLEWTELVVQVESPQPGIPFWGEFDAEDLGSEQIRLVAAEQAR